MIPSVVKQMKRIARSIINRRIKISDYFDTKFKKRALLSYTIMPFIKQGHGHSNIAEVKAIADILNELGYRVDIVSYENKTKLSYCQYDLIFGFGNAFENSFAHPFHGLRIYYSTGAHPYVQVPNELQRVKAFNKRNGTHLQPKRIPPYFHCSWSFSDHMIQIGNDHGWPKTTYESYTDIPISTIPVSNEFHFEVDVTKKQLTDFIWLGSGGSIHKGLDLAIEAFRELPEYTLHVAGHVDDDFMAAYEETIGIPENVRFYGYLNIAHPSFLALMQRCAFAVFPSCSESQSSSLILAMGYGCIPIATVESGVDVDKYGITISQGDIEHTVDAIKAAARKYADIDVYRSQAQSMTSEVRDRHSVETFTQNMKGILSSFLSDEVLNENLL